MQFTKIALFAAASTMVAAAPVEDIEARTGSGVCCPKGKHGKCTLLKSGKTCPTGNDVYSNCLSLSQIGLLNLFVCDVLNNLNIAIPITVSVPILS